MSVEIPSLVDVAWLRDHQHEVVLIDATTLLHEQEGDGYYDLSSGRESYLEAHIPGAVFADLYLDFADPASPYAFTVLDSETFAERIGVLGVGNKSHVVVYDHGPAMWATRLWWNLRLEGFDRVSVLDGGMPAWVRAGMPIASGEEVLPAQAFVARRRPELIADTAQVLDAVRDDRTVLVSAIDEPTHRGAKQTYARRGRIPRSANLSWMEQLDGEGHILELNRIREYFTASGALDANMPCISYCGSGIAATLVAWNLARFGRDDVAVYDGSLTEWTADERYPLEVD